MGKKKDTNCALLIAKLTPKQQEELQYKLDINTLEELMLTPHKKILATVEQHFWGSKMHNVFHPKWQRVLRAWALLTATVFGGVALVATAIGIAMATVWLVQNVSPWCALLLIPILTGLAIPTWDFFGAWKEI